MVLNELKEDRPTPSTPAVRKYQCGCIVGKVQKSCEEARRLQRRFRRYEEKLRELDCEGLSPEELDQELKLMDIVEFMESKLNDHYYEQEQEEAYYDV